MTVKNEISLKEFPFWSGAKTVAAMITDAEMDAIEDAYFDDCIYSMTDVNDFFWFDTDEIAEFLGYENYEEMFEKRYKKS